jgi:SAM-dependent methyltransferase
VAVDRPADLDAVRASYDAVADNYVAMVGEPGPWHRAAIEAFARDVSGVGPVLDVGCGPGRIAGSLGGVVAWWSLFNLPRDLLPRVIAALADALRPGGSLLLGMHRGKGDVARTRCYGGVPVEWTTHLYELDELIGMVVAAGLEGFVELCVAAETSGGMPGVIICARRPAR